MACALSPLLLAPSFVSTFHLNSLNSLLVLTEQDMRTLALGDNRHQNSTQAIDSS